MTPQPAEPTIRELYQQWMDDREDAANALARLRAVETEDQVARYQRDHSAGRLARSLIAAGHPNNGFLSVCGTLVRMNGGARDNFVEIVEVVKVEV